MLNTCNIIYIIYIYTIIEYIYYIHVVRGVAIYINNENYASYRGARIEIDFQHTVSNTIKKFAWIVLEIIWMRVLFTYNILNGIILIYKFVFYSISHLIISKPHLVHIYITFINIHKHLYVHSYITYI